MEKEKIIIDCFGCDDPESVIKGVAKTIRNLPEIKLIAAGNRKTIEEILKDEEFDKSRLEILDAEEIITNDDSPVDAIMHKKNSSLVQSFLRLKNDGEVAAMVSAGSTGAVLAGSSVILGRCEGVDRPALSAFLPTDDGKEVCLVDCGANVDCRPEQLLQFSKYGADYMRCVHGIAAPRIGLLSVGTEDKKGNALGKATFKLLKDSDLNFKGNIEARTVLCGDVDVVVTDGFAGNVLLKTIEGTANSMIKKTLYLLKKHLPKEYDGSFIKSAFAELMQQVDFNSLGGGVILGVKKVIVKCHGSSNSDTIFNSVRQAVKMLEGGFNKTLK